MPLTRTIFSNFALQKAVDNAVARIPEGHKVALVAHADLEGTSLSVIAKVGDHWSIEAAAIKPWHGALLAEAEVVASW